MERILTALRCYFYQDSCSNAVHTSSRPCFCPRTIPLYSITREGRAKVSVTGLAPSILGARDLDQ